MIRVAEILSDTNIGGAGRLLLNRFALSDKEQFEERIVLPSGSELFGEFKKLGYTPHTIDFCKDKSCDISGIFPLYRYFLKTSPDIVNCHGCLSARIAAKLANVPVRIYTRHCAYDPSDFMKKKSIKRINRIWTKVLSHKIIAVAEAAKDNLTDVGIDEGMIEIIVNGVEPVKAYSIAEKRETRKELGIPEDAFVCGICARLEDCKGIDVLLRAARKLLRSNNDYYFLIVGKGSQFFELKELSYALGISDRVKFSGFAKDVTPYLNCFDLNLNCSRGTETSSLSISEGMSLGLPCIASSWGGNPHMVQDGYNGYIFPVDDFIYLAELIEKIYNNKELYNQMSENAYKRYCEEFTAKRMTRLTEKLYMNLYLNHQDKRREEAIAK